jgi:putative membrane protein
MGVQLRKVVQFTNDYETREAIILRDHLAMERTRLANERTLLAYVRTALYLLLGGLALLGLQDFENLRYLGHLALVLSGILLMIGLMRFWQLKRHLKRFYRQQDLRSSGNTPESRG